MKKLIYVLCAIICTHMAYAQPHTLPANSIELIPGQVYGSHATYGGHIGSRTTTGCPGTCNLADILSVGDVADIPIQITDDVSDYTYLFPSGLYESHGGTPQIEMSYNSTYGPEFIIKDPTGGSYGRIRCGSLPIGDVVDVISEGGVIAVHNTNIPFTVAGGSSINAYEAVQDALFYTGTYQGGIVQNADNNGMALVAKSAGTSTNYLTIKPPTLATTRQQYWADDSGSYQIVHSGMDVQTVSSATIINIVFSPTISFIPSNVVIVPRSPAAAAFWHNGGYVFSISSSKVTIFSSIPVTGTCVFGYEIIK